MNKNKYFGTDGIRGNADNLLTNNLCYSIGKFLANYHNKTNKILIGRDTRESGERILHNIVLGLIDNNAFVYDLGITTTPSISYLLSHDDSYDFGIMISASHNPYYDNGIKIFAKSGIKIEDDLENKIETFIENNKTYNDKINDELFKKYYKNTSYLLDKYLNFIASKYVFNKRYKIAIDCANGSTSIFAYKLFNDLLKQDVTIINDKYNGKNINDKCGSTHIETLSNFVKNNNFDLGFSFDGDGDRLIVCDQFGNVCNGDKQIFLGARYLKENHKLKNNKVVVTIMSNLGFLFDLVNENINYDIVDVGDKNVYKCLKDNNLSLGGEQSGHIIYFDDLNTGDGLLSAMYMLNIISYFNADLHALTKDLHSFPQIIYNFKTLNKDELVNKINHNDDIKNYINTLTSSGRVSIRQSGTEPLVRIMVEAKDDLRCKNILDNILLMINKMI